MKPRLPFTPERINKIINTARKQKNPNGRPLNRHQLAEMFETTDSQIAHILETGKPLPSKYYPKNRELTNHVEYTEHFKLEVVRDYFVGRMTAKAAGEKHGVHPGTISEWARKYGKFV